MLSRRNASDVWGHSLIRYSWLRRWATEPLPDEELLVKAAYSCLVNSVCHRLFRAVLVKNTHVNAYIEGKRRWLFSVSSRYGTTLQLGFEVYADRSRVVRYYTGKRCHADIEKVYRWAVSIAGQPPQELLDRVAASDRPRPRSSSRWQGVLKVILWPFALQVSAADETFTLHWTSRRMLILLLTIGLSVAQYIGYATETERVAAGMMLIAIPSLTLFLVLTKNWRPRGYFYALRDIYKNISACQKYMSSFDATGNMSFVDEIEQVCARAQPAFREIAKRYTFQDRIGKFYQLLLSYFPIWARLIKTKGESRSVVVCEDILLNPVVHSAMHWLTFWMDHKQLLDTNPENFANPLNSPDTHRNMIDDLSRLLLEKIEALKDKIAPSDASIITK